MIMCTRTIGCSQADGHQGRCGSLARHDPTLAPRKRSTGAKKESGGTGLRAQVSRLLARYALASGGALWYVKYVASPYSAANVPDYLLCVAGQFGAIELKREGKNARAGQAHELHRIATAGGTAMVCRSLADVDVVLAVLRRKVAREGLTTLLRLDSDK